MTLDELMADYDWAEAFGVSMPPQPTAGYAGSLAPFTRDDVAEVLAVSEGENDERNWLGAFRLADGRFAYVTAWCDYTGWGCRGFGTSWVADSFDALIQFAYDDDARARLLTAPVTP